MTHQEEVLAILQPGAGKRMLECMNDNDNGPSVTIPLSWLGITESSLFATHPKMIAHYFRMYELERWLLAEVSMRNVEAAADIRRTTRKESA